jgi:exosortase
MISDRLMSRPAPLALAVLFGALAACLLWAYWPVLGRMAHTWLHDPQYSHAYLVPVFAAYLLWRRRDRLGDITLRYHRGGLPLLGAGVLLWLAGAYLYLDWFEAVSLLVTLAGCAVLLGGRLALGWSWPAIAFLIFMVPLPHQVEVALAHPLQRVATVAGTYTLQTIGVPALAEGNVILLTDGRMGVEEACGGLSMLLTFFALAAGLAILIRRPLWEKLVLVASAIPIALAANVIRIAVTGVLHETAGPELARAVFHDLAGWFMMPLALVLLWLELVLLSSLVVETGELQPVPLAVPKPAPARSSPRQHAGV